MAYDVQKEIENFVNKEMVNKQGIKYETVPMQNRAYVQDFLETYYKSFVALFKDEKLATKIFVERLRKIDAIRLDDKDKSIYPIKFAFDNVLKDHGKLAGGYFMPKYGDGVILLDMDNMTYAEDKEPEARHTLIHELTHGMTLFEYTNTTGKKDWQIGTTNHDAGRVLYMMNEGFTEIIAQQMWSKMYPKEKCPGIGRYKAQVEAVNELLKVMDNKDQVVEDYILCGEAVLNQLKLYEDNNGNDLCDYIKSFENKNVGNVNVYNTLINGLKNYKNKIIDNDLIF